MDKNHHKTSNQSKQPGVGAYSLGSNPRKYQPTTQGPRPGVSPKYKRVKFSEVIKVKEYNHKSPITHCKTTTNMENHCENLRKNHRKTMERIHCKTMKENPKSNPNHDNTRKKHENTTRTYKNIKVISYEYNPGSPHKQNKQTEKPRKTTSKQNYRKRHKGNHRTKHKKGKRKPKEKISKIKLLYANANGISGKIQSLQSAAETHGSHIITITETKCKPPRLKGYSKWIERPRKGKGGGGVAIAVRADLERKTQKIDDLEDDDQDVLWAQINLTRTKKLHVGVYYGKQETETTENVEREFLQLRTQVLKLKNLGPIMLTGDFNAKLTINKENKTQNQSRNGDLLAELLNETGLTAISTKSETGTWTRVKQKKDILEKSVIDYIIIRNEDCELVQENNVDEEGALKLKGKSESDHNTMTLSMEMPIARETNTIERWKLGNKKGWTEFNEKMKGVDKKRLDDYNYFEKQLLDKLEKTVGKITITTGAHKKQWPPEIKTQRTKVKENRKAFKTSRKNKTNIAESKKEYIDAQKELRALIEEYDKQETEKMVNKIIQEGGVKSRSFWQAKKRIEGKNGTSDYTTVDENGKEIKDPEKAMEHIANFFEDLYQPREGTDEHAEATRLIEECIEIIMQDEKINGPMDKITMEELKAVIRKLIRKKATGPDKIPNEVFIEAGDELLEIILTVLNHIIEKKEIPDQWQIGEIIRIYKGAGKIGKCSNERGITLSSNFGKILERIINDRIEKKINITQNQAGGQKGRSTSDHIVLIKEIIRNIRRRKKAAYIVFLDVTKAYDKAWLKAILHVMKKEGIDGPELLITKKLNENLRATIKTLHGNTRIIQIRDSIRQGGVLSVIEYAVLMDEINKELEKQNIGINMEELDEIIGCLLWMDDVVLIAESKEQMQKMLNITNEIAGKYRIVFGEKKSNENWRKQRQT